jgi:predicted dehydrogenase
MGPVAKVSTVGVAGGHADPPKTATLESRLRDNVWDNDIAIGGGLITVFDIHALDAAIWVLRQRPLAAMGASRIGRTDPHGDAHDVTSVIYEYADGLTHEHSGIALPNGFKGELSCTLFAPTVYAVVNYWDKARFQPRGQEPLAATVENLYEAGAMRNIATFYENVTTDKFDNPTVSRAVDGALTCVLGREASLRRTRLTMEQIIAENKPAELDLSGLKA